ncbi:unnamed protein product [Kuraishia capsulata CBS 1993]|uniref:Ribosome biogenesis protein YTM1 n=1 Tax=Kuraishia capsulata CBS 1993 TaxID=1382522 RepID=W6MMS3_9ASCO|nr:uncharacterized protein KUCA_T00003894001 [Kuraishia capsulata CBS 1993]CDK27914.1 unnamed protein product [Kuraishia capsulata CBS 1993]
MSGGAKQVKISFFTREEDEALHVSGNPLYVPVSLKRFGLSEIVNHLIDKDSERPTPFEFLINGTLLKTSLEDYLVENGLSNEAFLNLEYARAILPPSFLGSFSNEDWVSSVHARDSRIVSGAYDGIVRIYNSAGKVETQMVGHSAPVKSVRFVTPTRVVSSGNDHHVRLWKIGAEGSEIEDDVTRNGNTLAILQGHKAPVVSLAVHESSSKILSAGYDNTVGLWSTNVKEMQTVQAEDLTSVSTATKKRAKLALKDGTIKRKAPLALLDSHSGPVEGVIFDASDSTVGYSVSQDHTIKTWDLVTSRCVDTRVTSYSLLSVVQLPKVSLLACGSSARHINLHDPRVGDTSSQNVVQSQLIGHSNFVVSLAASPENDYMLVSASHDGTCKVWDVRANKSMYTIFRENSEKSKNKVFGVDWDKQIGIVSGGDDKKLQINQGLGVSQ